MSSRITYLPEIKIKAVEYYIANKSKVTREEVASLFNISAINLKKWLNEYRYIDNPFVGKGHPRNGERRLSNPKTTANKKLYKSDNVFDDNLSYQELIAKILRESEITKGEAEKNVKSIIMFLTTERSEGISNEDALFDLESSIFCISRNTNIISKNIKDITIPIFNMLTEQLNSKEQANMCYKSFPMCINSSVELFEKKLKILKIADPKNLLLREAANV